MDGRRIFGTGWTLGIWEEADGRHRLDIPVSSGMMTRGFDFAVGRDVHAALAASPRKAQALEIALHGRLQVRMTRGAGAITDAEVHAMIAAVVPLDDAGLDAFIAEQGIGPQIAWANRRGDGA